MSGLYEGAVGVPEIITIVLKNRNPKVKRKMFCMNCGGFLQYTYMQIVLVVQGAAEPTELVTELRCFKCKAIYEVC